MYKAHNKHSHDSNFDLHGDLEKIKKMLGQTSRDMKGRAGEILAHSIDDVKEKTAHIQENVSDYVAERPIKSIGLAMLTGIVIGYFLHRH